MRRLWIVATAFALTFLALDSTARLRAVSSVTALRIRNSPALEEGRTVSGYAGNQHQLIMPAIGTDGYNWIMQTERMVAGTEGWRVRHVDYDHPPDGRGVEWGGFLHWEVAGMAWLGTHLTAIELSSTSWTGRARDLMFGPYRRGGLPMSLAIARVAPWTNTATLVLFILIAVPLVAWRFGSVPASLLALGVVGIHPLYELFSVGYLDHHGLAAAWGLLTVLFLVAGGAGWLRSGGIDVSRLSPAEQRLWNWLPVRARARRWFVASAIAGGAGLWESASSEVPVLVGVGLGAIVSTAWLARSRSAKSAWQVEPALWRVWGAAGSAASLFFYLLEYFPSHFGWNLEINHPLYALAWLGAGDLLCRVCEWTVRGSLGATPKERRRATLLAGADLLAMAALPVTIALTSDITFVTADRFLWSLCRDYILENQSLFSKLARMSGGELLGRMIAVPLLWLPAALMAALVFGRPRSFFAAQLPRPSKGLISLALFPSLVLVALAILQSRWLGLGCAVWLAGLLALPLGCANITMSRPRWLVAGSSVFVVLLLAPFPAQTMAQWSRIGLGMPVTQIDLAQVITRDVSYRLRQRLGSEPGVIVSGPSATVWMTYFGGFKGLGTLYADNLDGLKAAAAIYSASSPEAALELCRKYGVTHFAIFSWYAFAEEYPKLWHGLSRLDPTPQNAFVLHILQTGTIPNWLRPIPYSMPPFEGFANQSVRLFEVVPDQTNDEAMLRAAQYLLAKDKADDASRQLRPLLAAKPDYLPALVCLARAHQSRGDMDAFRQTMQQIRANVGKAGAMRLDDRVDLAAVLAFAEDSAQAREQLTAALQGADEKDVRHLLPDTLANLVGLMRHMELAREYARVYHWAVDLLPPEAEEFGRG